jgi:hypothetical protein
MCWTDKTTDAAITIIGKLQFPLQKEHLGRLFGM